MDQKRVGHEVEQTLQCWDQAERLTASPFFATRVQARIRASSGRTARFGFGPLVRPVALGCLLVVNLLTVATYLRPPDQSTATRQELLVAWAQEYALYASDNAF